MMKRKHWSIQLFVLFLIVANFNCGRTPTGTDKKEEIKVTWEVTRSIRKFPFPVDHFHLNSLPWGTEISKHFKDDEVLYIGKEVRLSSFLLATRTVTADTVVKSKEQYILWNAEEKVENHEKYKNKSKVFGWNHKPYLRHNSTTNTGSGYYDDKYIESTVVVAIGPDLELTSKIYAKVDKDYPFGITMYDHPHLWWVLSKLGHAF